MAPDPKVLTLAAALYDDKGKPSPLLKTCVTHLKDRFREILKAWPEAAKGKASSVVETSTAHSLMKWEVSWPLSKLDTSEAFSAHMRAVDLAHSKEGRLLTPTMAKAGLALAPDDVRAETLAAHFRRERDEVVGLVCLEYRQDSKAKSQSFIVRLILHNPETLALLSPAPASSSSAGSWEADLRKLFSEAEGPLRERFLASHRATWEAALRQVLKDAGEEPDSRDWLTLKEWNTFRQAYSRLWGVPPTMQLALKEGSQRNTLTFQEAGLHRAAKQWAADSVDALFAKICRKVEELDKVNFVNAPTELTFLVSGERGGHKVVLDQTIVYNRSSQGTPFLQFPARFTVNGKSTSEAKYKAMFS